MPRGKRTEALTPDQARRLNEYRLDRSLSVYTLRSAMDPPFKAHTLQRAMDGYPIWEPYHHFLSNWIEAHCPGPKLPPAPPPSGRDRAAGEREE